MLRLSNFVEIFQFRNELYQYVTGIGEIGQEGIYQLFDPFIKAMEGKLYLWQMKMTDLNNSIKFNLLFFFENKGVK